jgi:iron-sulfur cluster insertion protein
MIEFTDAAAIRLSELIYKEGNPDLKVRLYIIGGGCAGFSYGFNFEEKIEIGDYVDTKFGVALLVDPISLPYLEGAKVDYKDDLHGARLIISNPNAITTCGCGSSFGF